jgi:integrase/recombinase XerC/integrase/recombinase XerD
MDEQMTIAMAIERFLAMIQRSRSQNTYRSYSNALSFFLQTLSENEGLDPSYPISGIKETLVLPCIDQLRLYSPATEKLYLTAIYRF